MRFMLARFTVDGEAAAGLYARGEAWTTDVSLAEHFEAEDEAGMRSVREAHGWREGGWACVPMVLLEDDGEARELLRRKEREGNFYREGAKRNKARRMRVSPEEAYEALRRRGLD